jgi:Fe-S cluster biosynthesis and repair protein YggX
MSAKILCKKLKKDLPALSSPPMPGPKGLEIMNSISEEAWEMWKSHQTTLINEKHLDMSNAEYRKWLIDQMDKFFNNEDYEKASGFKALD